MTQRVLMCITITFLSVFMLCGCGSGDNPLDFPVLDAVDFARGLVFFEQHIRIEGDPGSPYIFIDFPTYRFNEEEGVLVSFNEVFGSEEGKINPQIANLIIGEGTSLSGSAGSGAASGLEEVRDFPFTTEYQLLSIQEMRPDGSLLLKKASTSVRFFDFTFSSPLPSGLFIIRPGERLEYSTSKNFFFAGTMRKLTLKVQLRCAVIDRTSCQNGSWGDW
jgi:hypothetical protein